MTTSFRLRFPLANFAHARNTFSAEHIFSNNESVLYWPLLLSKTCQIPPPPFTSLERQSKLIDLADVPIVHEIYESYKFWHQIVLRFPKSERYSLGQECGTTLLKLLECILGASGTKDKTLKIKFLTEASIKLDLLKLLVRLAKDCGCLHNKSYLELQSKLHSIGKMLGGWIKSIS